MGDGTRRGGSPPRAGQRPTIGGAARRPDPLHRSPLTGALGIALPSAATAAVAALPLLVTLPGTGTGVPLPLLLVIAVQLVGLLLGREMELPVWGRLWLQALITTAVVLPLAAVQSAAGREPFVSLALGSAGTLVWSTAAALAGIAGAAIVAAAQAADEPENASVFFTPTALLVPAVLGAPGALDLQSTMALLAESMALAALVTALAWLLPRGARLLACPTALLAQFAVLAALGYRPQFGQDHGTVVAVAAGLLLLATIVAAVLVPVAALTGRRFLQTLAAERGGASARATRPPSPTMESASTSADWDE